MQTSTFTSGNIPEKALESLSSSKKPYETISEKIESMINNVPKEKQSKEYDHSQKVGLLRKPLLTKKILVLGGVDPYSCPKSLEGQGEDILCFDIYLNRWKSLSAMPGSKHHHSAAVINDKIYVMGGTRLDWKRFKVKRPEDSHKGDSINLSQTLSKDIWCFNSKTLEWSEGKDMLSPRRDFALVATSKGIFIIGGEGPKGCIESSVHFYNIFEDKWSEKKSLNIPRTGLCAALVGCEIWVAGGLAGKKNDGKALITDSVEVYNITMNTWTKMCHLKTPR